MSPDRLLICTWRNVTTSIKTLVTYVLRRESRYFSGIGISWGLSAEPFRLQKFVVNLLRRLADFMMLPESLANENLNGSRSCFPLHKEMGLVKTKNEMNWIIAKILLSRVEYHARDARKLAEGGIFEEVKCQTIWDFNAPLDPSSNMKLSVCVFVWRQPNSTHCRCVSTSPTIVDVQLTPPPTPLIVVVGRKSSSRRENQTNNFARKHSNTSRTMPLAEYTGTYLAAAVA